MNITPTARDTIINVLTMELEALNEREPRTEQDKDYRERVKRALKELTK